MLVALRIRDFVLVDRLTLELGRGFTVLTGETGAGKSILLDALALILGERADPEAIRQGASRAEFEAHFDVSSTSLAGQWLEEQALASAEGECLIRRVVERSGKSRAFINGSAVTATQLRALGDHLIDIHGQHAHQRLLLPVHQRTLLDTFGGHDECRQFVRQAWQAWEDAQRGCAEARQALAVAAGQRQMLEDTLALLADLTLHPGHWEELLAEHARLAHRADLVQGVDESVQSLEEGESAVRRQLLKCEQRLAQLASHDSLLIPWVTLLESARIQIEEVLGELHRYARAREENEDRLPQVEEEMQAWHARARRLHVRPEDLPKLFADTRQALEAFAALPSLEVLERQEVQARQRYDEVAQELSRQRRHAASRLGEAVSASLGDLALGQGRFEVALSELERPGPEGRERVEFQLAAHASQPLGPLARIASGGELSRLGLALQTRLAQGSAVPTLIFDEVDSGIGGGVAERVGQLLAALGNHHQVLCVTHLPQVAACAQQHLNVSKAVQEGVMTSSVRILDEVERVEEVARMLGGVTVTATVREHARELLHQEKKRAQR
ncbi:MAG: DNA repair protein RecN [Ferrovum sp.]|jgi:DNA repair protein RecN (Recombination protein N)|nr:DNA repair protein RecN [Ferrovum sp.]